MMVEETEEKLDLTVANTDLNFAVGSLPKGLSQIQTGFSVRQAAPRPSGSR